ncbi:restriction endonuclease [Clostridium saudiense]|uniref:Restriction endonuclease n=1 Tax=Clostridium saudiense TaxID=1414720 RepID=A0ABS2FJF5_9CLOT|nr:restriction endonuclease [Clostridium saudiense]MBM6820708.1 restriction endonuclease [Clostridium saudiense]
MDENIWLHRISHCWDTSYKLLENGYLSIGFSQIATDEFWNEFLSKNNYSDKGSYFDKMFEEIWGPKKRSRYSLWRFLTTFKDGDLVLVPTRGEFSIYRLIGKPQLFKSIDIEYVIENIKDIDLGFVWKVEPVIRDAKRNELYSRALTSRMKIRDINANISDLRNEIIKAIEIIKSDKMFDIHEYILESIRRNLEEAISERLNDNKFEKLIKWYMKKSGATDVYMPAKNEVGKVNGADADVIAVYENLKIVFYIQAKYHKGCTEAWAIEQINEYKKQMEETEDEYTYIPWVISSAESYSQNARIIAKKYGVRLVDIKEFCNMIIDVGIEDINEAFT